MTKFEPNNSPKILFVIAALNEGKNIGLVIKKTKEIFPSSEILVVDGFSTDETVETSLAHEAQVIQVSKFFGIGGAVEAGMLYADKFGYDIMIRIDADGQHDPSEVKKIFEVFLREKIDLMIGSRFLGQSDYKPNLIRSVAINTISLLMNICYKANIKDCTSGCHIYSRPLFSFFAKDHHFNYSEVLVICLAKKAGFKVKEGFINMQERAEGVSTFTLKNAFFYVFRNIIDVIFTMPLRPAQRMRIDRS